MLTALIALPLAAQLNAFDQSQFTRPAQPAETTRFRDMDRNNDGMVTRGEWRGTDQSFRAHDWNRDGVLSGDELVQGAPRPFERGQRDEGIFDDREDTFENLDRDRNGQIERSEWHASDDAFRWLDRNSDGVLSRAEVVGRSRDRRGADRSGAIRNPRDPRAVGTTGGTVMPRAGENCEDNAARIVDDIYKQVLERSADPASAGFTESLGAGRTTVRDIVAQLAKSDEHATRYFWQPMVTTVYQKMLNRDPSQDELQQAVADLASGRRQIVDVIARSARRSVNSDEDAVRLLYRVLLDREPDPDGLRGHTERARRDGIESVGRSIVASPEYRQKNRASLGTIDEEAYQRAVRTVYRHVFARDPEPWMTQRLAQMAVSSGFDALVDAMIASPEYQQQYGDDVIPGRGVRYCGPVR